PRHPDPAGGIEAMRFGRVHAPHTLANTPRGWRRGELTGALGGRGFAAPDFVPVPAVDGLDVEDLAAGDTEDALHRRRHVFVHAIGELDDHDRALARGSYK